MPSSPDQDPAQDPKDPFSKDIRRKFETKSHSKFVDPCQEAAQRSYKCLFRNDGDKSMCSDYFQAYKDCKAAWTETRKASNSS
ncbi:Mitochondrial copper homeostasis protein [Claviceps cyperi]|nr:Mitochondrial copper homeostasis protein [Claviceps cyperi]